MSKYNPKVFYEYVNANNKIKSGITSIFDEFGYLHTNREAIANIFNKSFNSVFVHENKDNIPLVTTKTNKTIQLDVDNLITRDSIEKKLEQLDINKSVGVDGVSPYVINKCHSTICKPLLMFKKSLKEEKVPELWKLANVTPLFKKGEKSDASNYRPISLTSIPCKVLESIIRDEMMNYLLTNGLLNENQHGF
nr:uncharacterized protein LOC124816221 [Hydra vulgaris]